VGGFGFTWFPLEGGWIGLRSHDGRYKRIDACLVALLRDAAKGYCERSNLSPETREAIDTLARDGFLDPGGEIRERPVPPDIRVGPRVMLVALLGGAIALILALRWDLAWPPPSDPRESLWAIPFFALVSILHEAGHWVAARPYFRARIGFGLLNGVFPAIVTRTSDAWACPRGIRIWINLAGIAVELMVGLALALVYLVPLADPKPISMLLLVILLRILFVLNPLLEGDGYWLLSDALGAVNLRSRGWAELRRGHVTPAAGFAALSVLYTLLALGLLLTALGHLTGIVG
jgi:hypothetical protein